MVDEILNLVDVCQLGEWLDMYNMPADVQILIGGKPYPLSEFVKKIKRVIRKEAAAQARELIEDRAIEFELKVQSLLRLADDVTSELRRGVLKIIPEAITEEDC